MLIGTHERVRPQDDNGSDYSQSLASASQMSEVESVSGYGSPNSNFNPSYNNTDMYSIQRKFYEKDEGGLYNTDRSKIYYLGIIDIFTEYNMTKKGENFVK